MLINFSVVDVRNVIDKNGGVLPLRDLALGNYNVNTPYGEGNLQIGTRLLSDLNDDGKVDNEDLQRLSDDWLREVEN